MRQKRMEVRTKEIQIKKEKCKDTSNVEKKHMRKKEKGGRKKRKEEGSEVRRTEGIMDGQNA